MAAVAAVAAGRTRPVQMAALEAAAPGVPAVQSA
jgi:hypothetical protein